MLKLVDRGGQGSPLVLLHGFLGYGDDWLPVISGLKKRFHCYTVDLPGHGQSEGLSGEREAFAEISDKVHRLLLEHQLIPAIIIGYSLGGRIALAYAQSYPGDVELLVLEGANPGLKAASEKRARLISDKNWARRFRSEPLETVLDDWYRQSVFASMKNAQRISLIEERCASNNGQMLADTLELCSLGLQPDWWHVPEQLKCNVVYLAGERDDKFLSVARVLEKNGSVCTAIVANAGHNAHRDNPEGFLESLSSVDFFSYWH